MKTQTVRIVAFFAALCLLTACSAPASDGSVAGGSTAPSASGSTMGGTATSGTEAANGETTAPSEQSTVASVTSVPTSAPTTSTTSSDVPYVLSLMSIGQLNQTVGEINSHADDWNESVLEPNFRALTKLDPTALRINGAYYPRLKKVNDSHYILFYQDAQVAKNIYCQSSSDLKNWKDFQKLFASYSITVNGEADTLCYSTCDALVLQNGDILAVASFRSSKNFRRTNEYNGLALRRSSDGGKTWTPAQIIYKGSNWEPQLLQLPSGEIQIYFTHGGPKIQPQMEAGIPKEDMVPSSGTAIIRSYDNGYNWVPYVMEPPYAAHRVSQQYTHTKNGIKVFTDQMPCAVLLNGTNTIAVTSESKFLQGSNEVYYITMSFSHDNWAVGLGIDEEGPADKLENMWLGSAPYMCQFPSGETVLSNNRQSHFYIRLGDAQARHFGEAFSPFTEVGFWGSLEMLQSHIVAGVFPNVRKVDGKQQNNIMIGQNVLNHRIDVPVVSGLVADGDNRDWAAYTDALFVGSETQAQTSVRFARDSERLYLLNETLDEHLNGSDCAIIYLTDSASTAFDNTTWRITVGARGDVTAARYDGSKFVALSDADAAKLKAGSAHVGTIGTAGDQDGGYLGEICIPISMLLAHNGRLRCNVLLRNDDGTGFVNEDTIGDIAWNNPKEWMVLDLQY